MKHLVLGLSFLTSLSLCAQIELSRDVMSCAGQSVSSSNMQMSYTIGETFYLATIENDRHKNHWFSATR